LESIIRINNTNKFGLEIYQYMLYNNSAFEKCLGVAQFGSALEWGSRGREFESPHSDHYYEKIRVTAVIHRLKNKVAGASVIFKCHGCFTL
jgi:hypothetical protein